MLEYCIYFSDDSYIHIDMNCLIIIVIRPINSQVLNFVLTKLEPNILSYHRRSSGYITLCIQFGLIETLMVLHKHGFTRPEDVTDILANPTYVCQVLPIIVSADIDLNWQLLFERFMKYHFLYLDVLIITSKIEILSHFEIFIHALSIYGCPMFYKNLLKIQLFQWICIIN